MNNGVIGWTLFCEFVGFCLYALGLYFLQPLYQKKDLTIVTVFLGTLGVGITMMTMARLVPRAFTWQEYEYWTVVAFAVSFVPMAIQQAIRRWKKRQGRNGL